MNPRLFVEQDLAPGEAFELPPEAAAHARAFRVSSGDPLVLFDGRGGEYQAEVVAAERKRVRVRLGEHRAIEREPTVAVDLLQAVGKGDRMDTAVEKAVELGVGTLRPVLTARTVVRLKDAAHAEKRRRHWQRVAIAACEQCGRNRVPEVAVPQPLSEALGTLSVEGPRAVLSDRGEERLSDWARGAAEVPGPSAAVLVGPEGGLTPDEEEQAREAGFRRVWAGERVLRTETAGAAALVILAAASGDL